MMRCVDGGGDVWMVERTQFGGPGVWVPVVTCNGVGVWKIFVVGVVWCRETSVLELLVVGLAGSCRQEVVYGVSWLGRECDVCWGRGEPEVFVYVGLLSV